MSAIFEGQTRVKFALFGCLLFAVEAAAKTIWPTFPFIEAISGQGGIIIGYITGRSYSDSKSFTTKQTIVTPDMGATEGK